MSSWDCYLYHNLVKEKLNHTDLGHNVDFLLFEKQIKKLKKDFDVVSPSIAIECMKNRIKGKYATIWFDDAYKSVKDIALPILNRNELTASVSICSSFYSGTDVFWRKKLALIIQNNLARDFTRFLEQESQFTGWSVNNMLTQTLDNFSLNLIELIDKFILEFSLTNQVKNISNEFCTVDDINDLIESNWTISNHSSNHYPITESSGFKHIENEFECNNNAIFEEFRIKTNLYVAPFCREGKLDHRVRDYALKLSENDKFLVMVNELGNKIENLNSGLIYRKTARVL